MLINICENSWFYAREVGWEVRLFAREALGEDMCLRG